MKLLIENFRKYELLCEIEREIEEYGPLDEGRIADLAKRLGVPTKELIAMAAAAGIGLSAVGGVAKHSYDANVEKAASLEQTADTDDAYKMPKEPMPMDLEWSEAPTGGDFVYVSPDDIPDDYVLPTLGKTKAEYEQELSKKTKSGQDFWDIDALKGLVFGSTGQWRYSDGPGGFDHHPEHQMAMLPPAWSIAHKMMLNKQRNQ